MLRRSKKRQTTLGAKRSPWTLKRWSAISASVMLGVAPTRERISAACPSIRAERRSPPCAPASQAPVLRHSLTSSIAVDGATPNRPAAPRQLMPSSSTARIIRRRRSGERGLAIGAGLHHQPSGKNHDLPPKGIPPIPPDRKMLSSEPRARAFGDGRPLPNLRSTSVGSLLRLRASAFRYSRAGP